jgi:formylglycine-generating enzyme required for sulfatase activity
LNDVTPGGYRLPSEAEWEYACRAGTTTPYSFEGGVEQISNYAWFDANSDSMARAVGQKLCNPWGLHDMHGNVWEWVEDSLHEDYEGAPADGTAWIAGGDASQRLLRGGSWYNHPGFLRSANRDWVDHSTRDDSYGFRLARAVL